jgi:hypothetical protein
MSTPAVTRLMSIFLLCVSSLLISLSVAAQIPASCFAPGNLVVTDSADLSIAPFHDIEEVYVAEPYFGDGTQQIAFTLKVKSLRPDLPVLTLPLGTWNVIFTNAGGTSRFVQMSTVLGSPQFRYGTVSDLLGVPVFNVQGDIQGTYSTDGRVTMYVPRSAVGSPAVSSVLSITSRTYVNTVGIGLVMLDDSGAANYTVLGNAGCAPYQFAHWGMNGDIPVANDYNRNGTADFAIWRPATGEWYSLDGVTGAYQQVINGDGAFGDIPVPGDYDHDRLGDFATYRPPTGEWRIRRTSTGIETVTHFGLEEDIPIAGDFDGDRVDDIAVWRPSNRLMYILNSLDSSVRIMQFGLSEDRPVRGDFDGDRRADVAVFRPSTGMWYYERSTDLAVIGLNWGLGTDVVAPEDYDGDGKTDAAVFRPENGVWYIFKSNGGIDYAQWGLSTDIVQPGDFNGNGRGDLAVFRPENGVWYVQFR